MSTMEQIRLPLVSLLIFFMLACSTSKLNTANGIPDGFVYLSDVDPSIVQEMRYAGNHNFIGTPIPGYLTSTCVLTQKAAEALKAVQTELKQYAMTLKVYDCYRPQKAVDSFVRWAKNIDDNKMKKEFYPKVDKTNLFRDGYIAEKSGHSRGSTVDLTIAPLPLPTQAHYSERTRLAACYLPPERRFRDNSLDFGTGFDCFDPLAHTANPAITKAQKQRRVMLKSVMEKNGFKNYAEEWWHYTLKIEPFPERYFDFDIAH
jgi:zinc D-Ala-D-Ala dipeptidase